MNPFKVGDMVAVMVPQDDIGVGDRLEVMEVGDLICRCQDLITGRTHYIPFGELDYWDRKEVARA